MQSVCDDSVFLFSGTSHPNLAQEVASHLGTALGKVSIETFPDGEISLQIQENVRGRDIFVFQSIALHPNLYLMELLIMIDALKRASARSIVAVIPYFGYCRQDRKDKPRVPITAKLVANLLVNAGATRILTVDLHADQVQGFFDVPVDHLVGRSILAQTVYRFCSDNLVVVAPDVGSIKRVRAYARKLNADMAIVDKQRIDADHVSANHVIGDVTGKDVLLADDMCSTGTTLASAAKACQEKGAKKIVAVVTHGLFVEDALEKIQQSPIDALLVSNTIPAVDAVRECSKIHYCSIAPLLAEAIRCVITKESISSL